MYAQLNQHRAGRQPSVRRAGIATLCASLVAFLAALPTAPASAGAPKPSTSLPVTVSALPTSEVEELLAEIPVGELDTAQLTEALSKLPGLSTLPAGGLKAALTKTIEGLTNKNATVGELLDPADVVPTLGTELESLLSPLELLKLESLLKSESLTTKLSDALSSLDPSQLLDTLLNSSGTPEQLLTQLFAKLNPEPLLGTTLTSEPFSKTTVGELAGELGMTPATLAKELDTTTTELPENATALTTPLTDGKTLGALDGLDSVTLGLLSDAEGVTGKEIDKGISKEISKESSNTENKDNSSENKETTKQDGGSGGPQPAGANTTTVVVNVPPTQSTATQPSAGSGKKPGAIRILSHRVKGRTVTLVVQVPGAGRVALAGKGVASVSRQTAKAERVTLRTTLTKAGAASMRRHRHKLTVKLKASFKPTGGASSSAPLTVHFT
jgi:hypothetical protein